MVLVVAIVLDGTTLLVPSERVLMNVEKPKLSSLDRLPEFIAACSHGLIWGRSNY